MKNTILVKDLPLESRLAILRLELLRRSGFQFIWTTKDERNVSVDKMNINHLKNAIKRVQNAIKVHNEVEALTELLPQTLDDIC